MLALLTLLRPKHWLKNLFVLAAPFFGGQLADNSTLAEIPGAFLCFSLCASAVYILNDLKDFERDRLHPEKKNRPLVSGDISKKKSLILMASLLLASLCGALLISLSFFSWLSLYVLIQVSYSFKLKHVPLADIFCVAAGFVIRVMSGGAAFNIEISSWLFITMFMISLMLASGKRISETVTLRRLATEHRQSLNKVFLSTLKEILVISCSASLIAYSLYTVEQSPELIYTVPVITFGLFRYLMLSKTGLGDPTNAMTRDRCLGFTVLVWLGMVGAIRYLNI